MRMLLSCHDHASFVYQIELNQIILSLSTGGYQWDYVNDLNVDRFFCITKDELYQIGSCQDQL